MWWILIYSALEAAYLINDSYHSTKTTIWEYVYIQNFCWG